MKITIDHPASRFGLPVILGDTGDVLSYKLGIALAQFKLGLTTRELAKALNVSVRTVHGWHAGKTPECRCLNMLGKLLAEHRPTVVFESADAPPLGYLVLTKSGKLIRKRLKPPTVS